MKKTYTCINSSFSFYVKKDNEDVLVKFQSTQAHIKSGSTLTVTDPSMQDAIEKSIFFGNVIKLKNNRQSINANDVKLTPTTVDPTDPTDLIDDKNTTTKEEDIISENSPIVVKDVKSYIDAKEWLRKEKNIPITDMPNVIAVLNLSKQLGISFPNWKRNET